MNGAASLPLSTTVAVQSWPVAGHDWAVRLLQQALQDPRGPRHAYLLLGPKQVGKSTLARAFAQTLLCSAPDGRPCGSCRACRLVEKGSYPDFRLIQPIDKPLDKDWSVDRIDGELRAGQAEEMIREATLSPMEGRYKVFLVQDAHLGNATFYNRILKTLEEPPAHVILLLTALDRSSTLPTIVSRCQVLDLRPVAAPMIQQLLVQRWQADPTQAELLARLASGRPGWAVEQLANVDGAGKRLEQLEQLLRLTRANRIERLEFAEQLATNRNNQQLFEMLGQWAIWWRDVLLAQSGCVEACCNIDQQAEIVRQAESFVDDEVRRYLHTLSRIEAYLHHTVNTRLALDVLLLQLPGTSIV
jgi:DNA polymerase III subunit delta'